MCTHFVHTFSVPLSRHPGSGFRASATYRSTMKKGEEPKITPFTNPKEVRPRGGRPSTERQKQHGWYAGADGMSLKHWWKDKQLFKALTSKRADKTRKDSSDGGRAGRDGSAVRPDLTKNFDLHAAFFWETLRRDPDSPRVRTAWADLIKSDNGDEFSEHSRMRRFRNQLGPEIARALDDFCAFWKMDYQKLVTKTVVPGGWLEGYLRLWDEVCEDGAPSLPLPWRFAGASSKVLHGSACVDLVAETDEATALPLDELLSPFRGKYLADVAMDFGLGAFAEAVDAEGVKLRYVSLEETLDRLGILTSTKYVQAASDEEREEIVANLAATPIAELTEEVHLRVSWESLKQRLKTAGLIPILVGVNPLAPMKLLRDEFGAVVESKLPGRRANPRKLVDESWEKIASLDQEVESREITLERTVREFSESAALDVSRLVQKVERIRNLMAE